MSHQKMAHGQRLDGTVENFVVSRPLTFDKTINHFDESQQTYVVEAFNARSRSSSTDVVGTLRKGKSFNGTPLIAGALHVGTPGRDASDAAENKIVAFDHGIGGDKRTQIWRSGDYAQLQASRPDSVTLPEGVRRLTPVECERLQGLPDDFTAWGIKGGEWVEISDSARYRMLGNAIAEPCAAWIGQRVVEVDKRQQSSL